MNQRLCQNCNLIQDLTEFSKSSRHKDGLQRKCRTCNKIDCKKFQRNNPDYGKNYRATHPENVIKANRKFKQKNPDYMLRYNYGISQEDYDRLYNKQNGACAICRGICSTGQKLSVDHDHSTKKVRGLLCKRCNRVLGFMEESQDLFKASMEYLASCK